MHIAQTLSQTAIAMVARIGPGHEWAAEPAYGSAGLHCCACGKDAPPGQPLACVDTPGWRNQFGGTCENYVSEGHCSAGAMTPGHEWADAADFGHPSQNCCACGKAPPCPAPCLSPSPRPPPSPPPSPPLPPPSPPPPQICEDVCPFVFNGVCQDGGPGAKGASCDYGQDCGDCGPRNSMAAAAATPVATIAAAAATATGSPFEPPSAVAAVAASSAYGHGR